MSKRPTVDYDKLPTEQPVEEERPLDTLHELQLVDLIHEQDRVAIAAVGSAREAIAALVTRVAHALGNGGRLIYVGAGTSGRLAALDAAECPPTFGTQISQVTAVIAGGARALARAVEGAEDSRQQGKQSMRQLDVGERDLVCGISASGVTAFVLAALDEARRRGAATALITCTPEELVEGQADVLVCVDVGGETIAGSTRMKAGLATKAVLHTVTTAAMIRLGKVYDNLMVDVVPSSEKLKNRAGRIVSQLTGLPSPRAARLLGRAGGSAKVAAVMHHLGVDQKEARRLLEASDGRLREVIGDVDRERRDG
jgi:N-acetylmuramic acid 6-phosphate etherase